LSRLEVHSGWPRPCPSIRYTLSLVESCSLAQVVRIKDFEPLVAFVFPPPLRTLIVAANNNCDWIQRCASVTYLYSVFFATTYSTAAEARVSCPPCSPFKPEHIHDDTTKARHHCHSSPKMPSSRRSSSYQVHHVSQTLPSVQEDMNFIPGSPIGFSTHIAPMSPFTLPSSPVPSQTTPSQHSRYPPPHHIHPPVQTHQQHNSFPPLTTPRARPAFGPNWLCDTPRSTPMGYLPSASPVPSEYSSAHTMSPIPSISSSLFLSSSHSSTARANANIDKKYKLQVLRLYNSAYPKVGQTPSHGYEPLYAHDARSERRRPLSNTYPCALGRCTQKFRFDTTCTTPVVYFISKKSNLKQVETVSVRESKHVFYEFRCCACGTGIHLEVFVEEVDEGMYREVVRPRG
jgi:hypothetical protein